MKIMFFPPLAEPSSMFFFVLSMFPFCSIEERLSDSSSQRLTLSIFLPSSLRFRCPREHSCRGTSYDRTRRHVFLGGIPRSKISKLFHYMYSTAPKPESNTGLNGKRGIPIAGLGYGLPIARLYAKYFQGNLSLASIENFGTSAYVTLKVTNPIIMNL